MTFKEQLKLELMVFAINNDFFGYGSTCSKKDNGRYISIVDGEKFSYTATNLAKEFDTLDEKQKLEILEDYYKEELKLA